ncbi:1H-3-hydroxy-4-oxoquinaldine 2,4-dioxygenase-like protein [Podospora fimiseda]|uniref:1H-3-hydroxy-4-oxoquinaldine 2,4-dioxygenase-like protein n=1 Tax=Podospora fimiseda TaxID=252190 RepID=A0AAN7BG48_9PEZI|nr:1H-3-hydroxy-4-oxoquinaldine 2,4-dioxygenase-like protein [Podospora fimiseda]
MATTTTLTVPHLGGTKVGYRLSSPFFPCLSTTVLINSMCTTVSLYDSQFSSDRLDGTTNLLAIEPLGHGSTSCPSEHFTYWDSAIIAIQLLDALKIDKVFGIGTSQGGWIVVRMALLAPDRILGLLPLGTSMDSESPDSRTKGAWDPLTQLEPFYEKWSSPVTTPEFVVDEIWRGMVASLGFDSGEGVPEETLKFWDETLKEVYKGDEGRKKVRMALICLLERDGLLLRLGDIKCPVYWLQGPQDPVFGLKLAQEQIKLFTGSVEARLTIVEGASHYLNATKPEAVEDALLEMIGRYWLE